jgi:hypothetical protein
MEWLVLWLICGFISGVITQNRGHGMVLGCLVGVLLGPFGIILALVMKPNTVGIEAQQIHSGHQKKCPFCAEMIKVDAVVCRHCGRDLPVTDPVESMIEYCRQYIRENPEPYKLEWLRRELVRDGHNPQVVDQAIARVTTP